MIDGNPYVVEFYDERFQGERRLDSGDMGSDRRSQIEMLRAVVSCQTWQSAGSEATKSVDTRGGCNESKNLLCQGVSLVIAGLCRGLATSAWWEQTYL